MAKVSAVSDSGKAKPENPTTLQTVERALSFLEVVAVSPVPLRIKEIAAELNVNLTTGYHLFNTLAARGYIDRNPDQTLRIGFQAAALYDGYRRGNSTQELMNEFVARLSGLTNETAWLSVLVNDAVVLTAFVEGKQAVRAAGLHVGLSGLEHLRSSGRAVLAHLDHADRDRMLERSLAGIPPSKRPEVLAELENDFELTRKHGWVLDDEGYNTGILGVAAPFFRQDGSVAGAVGIWSPASRGREHLDELVAQVLSAGREATEQFGRFR